MYKFVFTCENLPDFPGEINDKAVVTIEFEGEKLSHIVNQFEAFLRGCQYHFDGDLMFVSPEGVIDDNPDD